MANEFDEIDLSELPDKEESQKIDQPEFQEIDLDELPDQPDQTLKSALYIANRSNPETKAQAFDLAKKMSLPSDSIDFVERNYNDLKLRSDDAIIDFDTMIRKFPKTSNFLSNPVNATIAKDDHKSLTSVENRFNEYNFFDEWYSKLSSGLADLHSRLAKLPGATLETSLIFSNAVRKTFGLDQVSVPPEWINNDVARFYEKVRDEHKKGYQDLDASIYDELFENGDVAKASRLAFMQFTESLPTTAFVGLAGAAGALAGLPTAVAVGVGAGTAGLLTAAQSLGETIDRPEVEPIAGQIAAISKGAMEGLFEQLQILGPLKHWDKALEKAGKTVLRKEFWKEFGKAWFYSTATEGTTEALTQAGQDFSDYMTGVNPDLTFTSVVKGMFDAGVVGAFGGATTTSIETAGMAYQRQQNLRNATLAKDFYLAIGEDAKASKARERLPDSWKEHVDTITAEGPVKEIYIDVEDFKIYAQNQNIDPTKLAQDLGIVEEVSKAEESGSSITVPLSKWTTEAVNTEHYVGLSNDIRLKEDGVSRNQAKKQIQTLKEDIEREKQEAEKKEALKSVQAKEAREVGKQIEEQLTNAGYTKEEAKTVAKVQESFFKAFVGERAKKSIKDLFGKYGLTYSRGDESVDLKPGMIAETRDLATEFSDEEIKILEQSGIEVKRIPGTNVVDASAIFKTRQEENVAPSKNDLEAQKLRDELDDLYIQKRSMVPETSEYENILDQIHEINKKLFRLDYKSVEEDKFQNLSEIKRAASKKFPKDTNKDYKKRLEIENLYREHENEDTSPERKSDIRQKLLEYAYEEKPQKQKKKKKVEELSPLQQYLEDPNQQALDDSHKELLLDIRSRFLDKYKDADQKVLMAQNPEAQPYTEQFDNGVSIPNFESKPSGVIGKPGISQIGKSNNIDQLQWTDTRYGATKTLIKKHQSLDESLIIHTSSDLIARDDYMELLPKDTEINLWAATKNNDINKRIFPGNASRLRLETAYAKLKEAGFNVKLKEPTVDSIIEAAGIDQIRKSTGWDSENVIREELSKVVRPTFKVLKQDNIKSKDLIENKNRLENDGFTFNFSEYPYFDENGNEIVGPSIGEPGYQFEIYVEDNTGNQIASGKFKIDENSELIADDSEGLFEAISVDASFRRMGIATEIYRRASEETGLPISNKNILTKLGKNFRDALRSISPEIFKQVKRTGESPRGIIKIGKQSMDIKLFSNADITTPMHEFSHFSLEVMGDLFEDSDATEGVKEDYQKVLNFLGIENRSQIETKHHEMFADAMETYFLEGRSPSEGLRSVFNKLKDWFQSIYEYIKGGEGVHGVKLNDEIREVFDRMFATEAEILKNMPKPMFPDPAAIGMNPSQVDSYLKAQEEATIFAKDTVRQKIAKDLTRKQKAEYRERKKVLTEEWTERANSLQIYQAISILQTSKMPDGKELEGVSGMLKLDKKALVAEFGEEILKDLPRGVYAENGQHPDFIASAFGFESSQYLIDLLTTSPTKEEYVNQNVNFILDLEFKPIDPKTIEMETIDAIYNDKLMDMKQLELEHIMTNNPSLVKTITKKVVARPVNKEYVNQQAEKLINETLLKDIKPHVYDRAARENAKKAGEALAKGDIAGAFEYKRKEQLNIALYKKAVEAIKTKDVVRETVKKYLKKDEDIAKNRDMDLVDAGRKIISHYALANVKTIKEDPLSKLRSYDPDGYEHINGLVNGVIKTGKTFDQLTYAEFYDIQTALKAIWSMAKAEKEITINGKKVRLEDAIREMDQRVSELNINPKDYKRKRKETYLEEKSTQILDATSALTRVEAWVDSIDKDFFGPFRKYIWNRVNDAITKYRDEKSKVFNKYQKEILEKYKDLFEKRPDVDAREIGERFSPVELIMVILHSGNMSNKDKLIRGYKWGSVDEITGQTSFTNFDAFFNRAMREGIITERHLDFAQEIWDLLESFKADTQKAHKEIYGHYFDEISANEIQTPWGKTYRGGYIPAIADPLQDDQAAIRKAKNEIEETSIATAFPSTGRGATTKRVQAYAAPLSLNMNILSAHIDWALRFTHIQPAIKDVSKIVMNREFRDSIKLIDETAVKDVLLPWLQRSATQKVMSPGRFRFVDKIASNMRNSAAMQIMAISFSSGIQQLTGIFPAMAKVGTGHILRGARQFILSPVETNKIINELSPWMRSTVNSSIYETQNAIAEIVVEKDIRSKFKDIKNITNKYGYIFSIVFQGFVNNATWIGAFNKAIQDGFNQDDAIKYADSAVRMTQGSSTAENISNFETGSPSEMLFKQFISYFNMLYNLQSSQYKKIMRDAAVPFKAPHLVYVYALAHAIPAIISNALFRLVGEGYSDDDEEFTDQIIDTLFWSQLKTGTAMLPYGQALNAFMGGFTEKNFDDRINMSPGVQMFESFLLMPGVAYKKISSEEEFTEKDYRTFATGIGYLLGMPVLPVYRRAEYIYKAVDNQLEVETTPLEVTRGILTGKEQKQ